ADQRLTTRLRNICLANQSPSVIEATPIRASASCHPSARPSRSDAEQNTTTWACRCHPEPEPGRLTVHSTTRTNPATPNLSRSPTRAARREVALAPVHPRDPKADRHPALSNSHRSLRRSSRTCRNVKVNRYARPPYSRHRSKTRAISPARSKATNAEHLGHDHTEPHAMSPPIPATSP